MKVSRFADRTDTVYRFLIAFLVYLIGGFPTLVYALPQGGTIASGAGTIDTSGSSLTVNQTTNKIIINWESFSIGNNESVIFLQPDSSSSALNNVLGNSRTVVEGNLSANGQIVLSNPNGIFISPTANVNVASLIASTLKISEQDFLDGLYKFSQDPSQPLASILNEGKIRASDFAALIAPSVDNRGVVIANLGTVGLVSGKAATVDFVGDNLIKFTVNEPVEGQVLDKDGNLISDRISNSGSIQADGGQVILSAKNASGIIKNVINMDGVIEAKTVTEKNGRIFLGGGDQGTVRVAGTLNASGEEPGEQGGEITVEGADVIVAEGSIQAKGTDAKGGNITITGTDWVSAGGTMDVSGETGGDVNITTGGLSLAAPVLARGTTGEGGSININTLFKSWEVVSALLDVSGASGGVIKHFAGQQITTSGKYLAIGTDGAGGSVDVTANALRFLSNTIDASGTMGGGSIRLGGEYQGGKNLTIDEIPNAQTLLINDGANVTAKTTGIDGDGGRIIAWGDRDALVLGHFDVTPGIQSGAGGFVEVSSGDTLTFGGHVKTGIDERTGTLLLDPKNITIEDTRVFDPSSYMIGYGYSSANDDIDLSESKLAFATLTVGNTAEALTVGETITGGTSGATGVVVLGAAGSTTVTYTVTSGTFQNETITGGTSSVSKVVSAVTASTTYRNGDDSFGGSVSLHGKWLAVGGHEIENFPTSSSESEGAVFLYSYSDTGLSEGTLQAIIGDGYTGGNNLNEPLDKKDFFGAAVSLFTNDEGNGQLVVSASGEDGFEDDHQTQDGTVKGAVYLYSFNDVSFAGLTREARIGAGATGDNEIDLSAGVQIGFDADRGDRGSADQLAAVSLSEGADGSTRLAVGVKASDGHKNAETNAGDVLLFKFNDAAGKDFSGGELVAVIGAGYDGSYDGTDGNVAGDRTKDIDLASKLEPSDLFGDSVALDYDSTLGRHRLAVLSRDDEGEGDAAGAKMGGVYLFTFTDDEFSGGSHVGNIGHSYSGASSFDLRKTRSENWGGALTSVALEGNYLAVGASRTNVNAKSDGQVELFSFTNNTVDTQFNNIVNEGTLCSTGCTDAQDIDVAPESGQTIVINDLFGASVSLNGNRLVVGTPGGDGTASGSDGNAGSGEVYIFPITHYEVSDAVFATNPSDDNTIWPSTLVGILSGGSNVTLQANNDITVTDAISTFNTLTVGSVANNLTVGETITGGTSEATGVVVLGASGTTSVTYTYTSGTFQAGETITGGTSGNTRVVSAITGGGGLILQAGRSIDINASITTNNGALTLSANDTSAINTGITAGTASIDTTGAVITTGSGALTATVAKSGHHTSGDITLASTATTGAVTLTTSGNVTIDNGSTALNIAASSVNGTFTITNMNNVTVVNDSGLNFATTTVGGTLTTNDTNAFTVGETITGADSEQTAVVVLGANGSKTVTYTATNNKDGGFDAGETITGGTSGNTRVISSGGVVEGSLTATATTGGIIDSGVLNISGESSFTAADGQSILLDQISTFIDDVDFNASSGRLASVEIDDSTGIELQGMSLTGNLTVTAGGGITQPNQALIIDGTSSFTIDVGNSSVDLRAKTGDILLNDFGGAVSGNGHHFKIKDLDDIILGSITAAPGQLNITTGGAVTQAEGTTISASNNTTIDATGFDVTLGEAANDLGGSTKITGGRNVVLRAASKINIGRSTITGNLAMLSSHADGIVDANYITVDGNFSATTSLSNADIVLNEAHGITGTVTLNTTGTTGHATLDNGTLDLVLGNGTSVLGTTLATSVGGDLTLTSGAATGITDYDDDTVTVGGELIATTDANSGVISLGTTTVGGAITLVTDGTGNATLDNGTTDIVIGTSTTSSTATNVGGDLTLISGALAGITDNATVTVGGNLTATTDASSGVIDLGTLAVTGNFTLSTHGTGSATIDNGTADIDILLASIGGALTLTSGAATGIFDSGAVTVGGNLSATTDANNGVITLDNLAVDTDGGSTIAFAPHGSGAVTIVNDDGINFAASTVGGNLAVASVANNLTVGETITGGTSGATGVVVLGASSSTSVTYTGTKRQTTTGAIFQAGETITGGTSGNTRVIASSGVANGTLTATATTGNITQSGALTITGASSFTTSEAEADIDLATNGTSNNFYEGVSFTTAGSRGDVTVYDSNDFYLGASTINGNLEVETGNVTAANIGDDGIVTVTGTADLSASGTNNANVATIWMKDSLHTFSGGLSAQGHHVYLQVNATDLGIIRAKRGKVSITARGALTQTGTTAAIYSNTDTEIIARSSDTNTKYDVTLDKRSNSFGGNVNATATSTDVDSTDDGNLDEIIITSGNNVEVVSDHSFNVGASDITGNLTLTSGSAEHSNSGYGITDTGDVEVGGDFSATTTGNNGAIDMGTLEVNGTIALLTHGNGAATVVNDVGLEFADSTVGGALTATATAGDITQDTNTFLRITGAASFTAANERSILLDGDNTFDDASNASATDANVTFAASAGNLKNVTIKDSDELDLRALTLVQVDGAGGDLIVTAVGTLTDSGALAIPGTTTITATGQVVDLDHTSNNFGTITFGSSTNAVSTVEVVDTNGIIIGASKSTGDFTITAGDDVTDGGTVTVGGDLTVTTSAGNGTITLDQLALASGKTITLTTHNTGDDNSHATVVNPYAVKFAASSVDGDLDVTATTGDITQTGALAITGTTTLLTSADGADIDLSTTTNAFTGALTITTNDNTDYEAHATIDGGTTALIIAASTIDGNLTLTSGHNNSTGHAITDSGTVTLGGNLSATTDANNGNITLDQLALASGKTIALITNDDAGDNTGHATVKNTTALNLALSNIDGNFSGTATNGSISQTGNLNITGTATFITTANNSDIILSQSGNVFEAQVIMQAGNGTNAAFGNITFVDSGAVKIETSAGTSADGDLYLNASNDLAVGGNLNLTATTGNITQGAAATVGGTSTFKTMEIGADIDLATNGTLNAFGDVVTLTTSGTGGDATLDNGTTKLDMAASSVGGNLSLKTGHASGIINTNGTIAVGVNLTLVTDDNSGVINMPNLSVNGSVDLATEGSGAATVTNTSALKFAASEVGGNLTATATTGNITQGGALDIDGTTTLLTSADKATIDLKTDGSGNAFTGELLITTNDDTDYEADVSIDGGTTNLIIGTSTIDGDLTLLSGGTITDTDSSTVTVRGDINAATDANNSAITLDDLTVSGDFYLNTAYLSNGDTVEANEDITDTTIKLATGASAVNDFYNGMIVYISSGTGSGQVRTISDYVGNTRVATVTTWTTNPDDTSVYEVRGAGNATVVHATGIEFAPSMVGGNLTATATTGNVTQIGGALDIYGTTTITASASGADITLFNPLNNFIGAVSTTGDDVSLWTSGAMDLGAATVAGIYKAYAGTSITDSGAQRITGLSYIYTHDDDSQITLNHPDNSFGGTVDYAGGIGFTVNDTDATGFVLVERTLVGNLIVTAAGPVTQSGKQVIGGLTSITATGKDVTLDNSSNDFKGAVQIVGANVVVKDGSATTIGAHTIGIDLGTSTVSGTYTVTSLAGKVIDSGNLVIDGIATVLAASGQDINLDANNNFKNGIRLEGRNVNVEVASTASLKLGALSGTSTITGWLIGQSYGLPVTDEGALNVSGTTKILATGQNVTLNDTGSNLQGPLKIKGAIVSVTHPYAIELGDSTITGTYDVRTTTGNITDSSSHGTLDVTGNAAFTTDASDADIRLDSTTNRFGGTVTVNTAGTAELDDAEIHGGSTPLQIIASSGVGTLTLTTTGSTAPITDEGALVVAGTTTIDAGSSYVDLDHQSSDLGGAVGASGSNVSLDHPTGIDLGNSTVGGTYDVKARTGNITGTGALDIEGLTTLITSADGAIITLDGTGSAFTGNVKITTNETNSDKDAHATIDGGSTTGLKIERGSEIQGNLTLRSGHANTITDEGDSGVVTVDGNLTATTYANNGSITLEDLAVDGTIGLNTHGTGNATVRNDNGLEFASSTVGGDLLATATAGDITQNNEALAITGTTTLITATSNADIILGTASNAFTGEVTLNTTGSTGHATLNSGTTALQLGTSTTLQLEILTTTATSVGGNLAITAGAAVTDLDALTIGGTTTISASGVDVTLNSAANDFQGAVAIDGANVTVVNAGAIELGASTVTGTTTGYDITATGGVTQSSGTALTITGATTISAGGNVTLDTASNDFTGAVKIEGVNVVVVDANAIDLGASTVTGNYEVTATSGGNIENSGVLTIAGTAIFTVAGGQSITLDQSNTFSNTVTFCPASCSSPSGTLAGVSITDSTDFDLRALTLSGALEVASGGSITQSGNLTIGGTSSFTTSSTNETITLSDSSLTNAFSGAFTLSSTGENAHVTIDNGTTAIVIASASVGGNLTLTSGAAAGITDSDTVTVGGNLIATTDANSGVINMVKLAVDGSIALTTDGTGDATVKNNDGLEFATTTIGGDLTATATTGNITDTGTITVTGETNIYLGTNPILSVSGATSATDIFERTITLNSANNLFTGGITLHYENVLPPDNGDIDLARQVVFAELLWGLNDNLKNIYGAYEDINEHDILRMYELFLKSLPKPKKEFKVVKKHLSDEVIIKKIKTSITEEEENKEL